MGEGEASENLIPALHHLYYLLPSCGYKAIGAVTMQ